jgi:outer membrane protein
MCLRAQEQDLDPMKGQNPPRAHRVAGVTRVIVMTVLTASLANAQQAKEPATPARDSVASAAGTRSFTLEECLSTALQNNRRRPASRFAVAAAEAQHRQALAAYWPQISARGGYQRMDESPNFLFPASSIQVPAQTLPLPPGYGLAIVDPANNVVGSLPGFPAQSIQVPAQDVKLMDPDSFMASLNAVWLLYDGGMRRGYRQQARAGVEAAKQEARRTDLEITDSVKRMFYGAVLAGQVHQVGKDTLARMEATLTLTETMYKEGGGKVKKTDFLDNKVMVESLRSMVALLEKNEAMAQAALANTMGLTWKESVAPAVKVVPFEPYAANLADMVSTAYEFSPDWKRLQAGIQAAEGSVRTARSGFFPKLAVTGELHKWWNDYDAGIATDRNKEGWTVGVGLELPLFEGFLTRARVSESKARLNQINEQKLLLQEGIGLMVKDVFLGLSAAVKAHQATLEAMKSAEENRDLNTRAYQNELVETDKVIRAQLVEALMTAQHLKTRYDHIALQTQLYLIVGTELWKQMQVK